MSYTGGSRDGRPYAYRPHRDNQDSRPSTPRGYQGARPPSPRNHQDTRPPPRRDYPDDPPQPRRTYNPQWQDDVRDWQDDQPSRRPQEPDKDSAYGSGASGPASDTAYWRNLALANQDQLEENKETITDLTQKLQTAERDAEHYKRASGEYEREAEIERVARNQLADDLERVNVRLGEQYLRTSSWRPAIEVLEPVVQARRNSLRALNDNDRSTRDAIDRAQTALYSVELIYAKALSHTGQDTRAIDLLNTIYNEGQRRDPHLRRSDTREAQQQLCLLLERSERTEDWNKALDILSLALYNADRNTVAADQPWIVENRLIHAKILMKLKDYPGVLKEVKKVWAVRQSVPSDVRESIAKTTINITYELQVVGKHKSATTLMLTTLTEESRVSDSAIQSMARLSYDDLIESWAKCNVLSNAEHRRVGWELSRYLKNDKKNVEAVKILGSLPAGPSPPQDEVNDLHSRLLLTFGDFDSLEKAARLAAPLLKDYGYEPLPEQSTSYHPRTLLTAIEKMSALANRRDSPVTVYKEHCAKHWLGAFNEAKPQHDNVDLDVLELLARVGRNMRQRWKENAEAQRPAACEAGHPEREARDTMLKNIKLVEKWVNDGQR